MTPGEVTAQLKAEALRLGFDLVGAAPAVTPPTIDEFRQWLADGCAAGMHYLTARASAYEHPCHVLEGARSVLMLAAGYRTVDPAPAGPGEGIVSRYAWGDDYHTIIRRRLHCLADFHRRLTPGTAVRGVVDTAPLMERQFGQLAGLGWIGKNTMLLNQRLGSWFVLAALLTSEPLEYDRPTERGHCGTCTACLQACSTGALTAPYRLDARKCISYLTIESREPVPAELRPAVGARVFGCDSCQEACPWNRRAATSTEPGFQPRPGLNPIELTGLLSLDEAAFRQRFRGAALLRARRSGLLRNAAVALGNRPNIAVLHALQEAAHDVDPLVREACTRRFRSCGS